MSQPEIDGYKITFPTIKECVLAHASCLSISDDLRMVIVGKAVTDFSKVTSELKACGDAKSRQEKLDAYMYFWFGDATNIAREIIAAKSTAWFRDLARSLLNQEKAVDETRVSYLKARRCDN